MSTEFWSSTIDYLACAFLFIGAFFILTSAMGILRFRDFYTRLHAASKGSTFGFTFIVLGAALLLGGSDNYAKAALAIIFQFLTAPIAAHMIARVGLRRGILPVADPKGNPVQVNEPALEPEDIEQPGALKNPAH